MSTASEFGAFLVNIVVRFPLGVLAGLLPRRLWPRLNDTVYVSPGCSIALTFVLVFVLKLLGVANLAGGGYAGMARLPIALFAGSTGILESYLLISGALRLAQFAIGDSRGDPMLELLDRVRLRARARRLEVRAALAREALEGPEVPDRVVSGAGAGLPDAEWVVVSSRRKPEWTTGTVVMTSEKWYRLQEPVERQLPGGLRTLYPMSEVSALEAVRRSVRYEFPGAQ